MYIVTYKNENASVWIDSVVQFKTVEKAENWISENLPIGTQKCRTGEYDILKICPICQEPIELNASCDMCNDWKMD